MPTVTFSAREAALRLVRGVIPRCRKMQPKFAPGTPQATLLRNRIAALLAAEALLAADGSIRAFTAEQLRAAHAPLLSIRNKSANARAKWQPDTPTYRRLTPTIEAMDLCLSLLEEELARRA